MVTVDNHDVTTFMEQCDPKKTGYVELSEFLKFYQKYVKLNDTEFGWRILNSFHLDTKPINVFI